MNEIMGTIIWLTLVSLSCFPILSLIIISCKNDKDAVYSSLLILLILLIIIFLTV